MNHRRCRRVVGALYEPPATDEAIRLNSAKGPDTVTPMPIWAFAIPLVPMLGAALTFTYAHNVLAALVVGIFLLLCVCAAGARS